MAKTGEHLYTFRVEILHEEDVTISADTIEEAAAKMSLGLNDKFVERVLENLHEEDVEWYCDYIESDDVDAPQEMTDLNDLVDEDAFEDLLEEEEK